MNKELVFENKKRFVGYVPGFDNFGRECQLRAFVDVEIKKRRGMTNFEDLSHVEEGLVLSICGNIGNQQYGQCLDSIAEHVKDPAFLNLVEIWKEYHLNDLKAGTRRQTNLIKAVEARGWKYDYAEACGILKAAEIYDDRGYKYGHGWLYQEIPSAILEEVKAFFTSVEA